MRLTPDDRATITHVYRDELTESGAIDLARTPEGHRAYRREDLVRIATEVKAGGRHAWRRAIELAEVLCRLDAEGDVAPVEEAARLLGQAEER